MNLRRELFLKRKQIKDSEKMIEKMRAIKNAGEAFIEVSLCDSMFKAKVSTKEIQILELNDKGNVVRVDGISNDIWEPFYEVLHQIFGGKEG